MARHCMSRFWGMCILHGSCASAGKWRGVSRSRCASVIRIHIRKLIHLSCAFCKHNIVSRATEGVLTPWNQSVALEWQELHASTTQMTCRNGRWKPLSGNSLFPGEIGTIRPEWPSYTASLSYRSNSSTFRQAFGVVLSDYQTLRQILLETKSLLLSTAPNKLELPASASHYGFILPWLHL